MDLKAIPYKDRFSAAGLLISKANRLTELSKICPGEPTPRERKAINKGISYYRISLVLMKPFDPNYSTVLNWMSLALIRLGRFSDAVDGYKEIMRISDSVDPKAARNATAQLAEEQIGTYQDKKDIQFDEDPDDDPETFDDPPYCMFARGFCELLAGGMSKKAYQLLSNTLKAQLSAMMKEQKEKVQAVLTPEQLKKVESLEAAAKAKREKKAAEKKPAEK